LAVPKITDFGLAKRLDAEAGRPRSEPFLGTPHYMAPEQAAGRSADVGPATDVYALGAILYQLLTGRPPFQGSTVLAILEQVRSREPLPPSRLQARVPGELETICLKCLEKDPSGRYASAHDLAEDLRRFQHGEPILARPPAWWERLWKWARRRPAAAALAVVSSAAALALLLLGLWHRLEVQATADQARVHQHREERSRLRAARARYRRFVERRDEALFHGIYGTYFTDADVAENLEATRTAVRAALAAVRIPVAAKAPPAPDPYLSERENAAILGGCYQLLLVLAEAVASPLPGQTPQDQRRHVRQALQILNRAVRLVPPTQAYHLRRARYLRLLGDAAGARRAQRQAARLEPMTVIDYFLLGDEQCRRGDLDRAIRHFRSALRLQADDFWSHFFLAFCYLKKGLPEEAEVSLAECLAQRPRFLWTWLLCSFVEEKRNDFAAAEANYQRVLKLNPNADARYFLHVNRGRLRFRHGRLAAAAADLRQAIALKPATFFPHLLLARVYQKQQELAESDREVNRAIRLQPPAPFLAQCHTERARNLFLGRRYAAAVQACDEALQVFPAAETSFLRARALLELKRYREAAQSFARYREAGGPVVADFYRGRGRARLQLGDFLGARDDYTRVLEREPDAEIYRHRGWAYYFADAWKPALRDFEEAVRRDPGHADAYVGRGLCLVGLGRYRAAVADADEAWRRAPATPEMMHNVACIFALAVGKVHADRAAADRQALASRYQAQAVKALRQTLTRLAPDARPAFWRDRILPDAALDPIRTCPGFRELEQEYGRSGSARK
jgi:tetratricopeptide (TPR) repeat protein